MVFVTAEEEAVAVVEDVKGLEAEVDAEVDAEAVGPPSLAAPSASSSGKGSEQGRAPWGALQKKWRQGQGSAKDRAERRAARRE